MEKTLIKSNNKDEIEFQVTAEIKKATF